MGAGDAGGNGTGRGGYDAYFEQLDRDGVWGVLHFTLKRGKVTAIRYEKSYTTIGDALADRAIDVPDVQEPAQRT